MEKWKLTEIKNLLQHICVFFQRYNPPVILNVNTPLLNLNTASFDDDDDDDDDNDDHYYYCYHHHFISSTVIIIIIIIVVVVIIITIIIVIIIIFLLRKRVFFNRCLAVWYPFCFSGQAVYPFTAIKPSSRCSSFFYLFIYFVIFHSILSLFLSVFFYVQLPCVAWEVTK